jgi:acetyl esterase/lipase
MAFDDLPVQSPINPRADVYARRALELSRAVLSSSRCVQDIAYGPDYWQKVDVFRPHAGGAGLPVVVFLHGGGWTHGYKEWLGFMAPPITAWPALFVSASYRLAPQHRYPVQLDDTLSALAWVWRNIDRYGGDPNRIAIGGHSAGGHLTTLATLRTDCYAKHGLPPGVVKLCLPVSATFDFRFDHVEPGSGEENILLRFLADPGQAYEASPIAYAVSATTPFLVCHGSDDLERVKKTAPPMVHALEAAGSPVDYMVIDTRDHFSINLGMAHADDPWILKAAAMVDRYAG